MCSAKPQFISQRLNIKTIVVDILFNQGDCIGNKLLVARMNSKWFLPVFMSLGANVKGAVKPETFESLTDYVIENYFKHPSYWKIDGCPYFSIYEFHSFFQNLNKFIIALVNFVT